MKFKLGSTLMLLLVFSLQAYAQTTHQQAYWLRFYLRGKLDKKWHWHVEVDERRLILPDRQLQFIAHVHVHRKLDKRWEIAAGGTHSIVQEVPEWRLFQELHFGSEMAQQWRISGRLRSEQRWFLQPENEWQLKHRWRGRIQIDHNFLKKWRAKLSEEIMFQAGDFEQNRVYAAIERQFSKRISLEIGYLKIYQTRAAAGYFDRDVLRSTLYFNF